MRGQSFFKRAVAVAAVAGLAVVGVIADPADATLALVQPDAATPATFVGRGGVSTDGLGTNSGAAGTLQAEVPAGSTVVQAYLYATYIFGANAPSDVERTLNFEGTDVLLSLLGPDPTNAAATARANVTSIVAAKVGSGGGITDFSILEPAAITRSIDGTALVVIYSNPSLPVTTIAVLDGESTTTGDSFTFPFATPLEPNRPGFSATLALGSGHSFQAGAAGHACAGAQFSLVDINDQRISSCAGNFDDGEAADGALVTVGGVGDATDNPADPNATSSGTDDELYNLVPFLKAGDAAVTVKTSNPSADDNLFLAVLAITQEAGPAKTIPVAVDDVTSTDLGTPVAVDVVANDSDPDGVLDRSTLSIFTPPSNGTAVVADGQVVYTPNAGFTGRDALVYQVCGVDLTVCSQAQVLVDVLAAQAVLATPRFTG